MPARPTAQHGNLVANSDAHATFADLPDTGATHRRWPVGLLAADAVLVGLGLGMILYARQPSAPRPSDRPDAMPAVTPSQPAYEARPQPEARPITPATKSPAAAKGSPATAPVRTTPPAPASPGPPASAPAGTSAPTAGTSPPAGSLATPTPTAATTSGGPTDEAATASTTPPLGAEPPALSPNAAVADAMQRLASKRSSKIDRCYRTAAKAFPEGSPLTGTVTASCTVAPSGAITNVTFDENTTESLTLASCLEQELRSWKIEPFTGDAQVVRRTFRFSGK